MAARAIQLFMFYLGTLTGVGTPTGEAITLGGEEITILVGGVPQSLTF